MLSQREFKTEGHWISISLPLVVNLVTMCTKLFSKNSLQQPQGGEFRLEVRANEIHPRRLLFLVTAVLADVTRESVALCRVRGTLKGEEYREADFSPSLLRCLANREALRPEDRPISFAKEVLLPQEQRHLLGFLPPFA